MTTLTCFICATPPASLGAAALDTHCRCGSALRRHTLGPPHGCAMVGCAAFEAFLPVTTPSAGEPGQAALFPPGVPEEAPL